jgi:hypothetical protein
LTPGRGHDKNPAKENRRSLYPSRRAPGTPRGGDPPLITYRSNTDASPEAERAAIAAVLRYVLYCDEKRKAGAQGAGDDANKGGRKHDRAAGSLLG